MKIKSIYQLLFFTVIFFLINCEKEQIAELTIHGIVTNKDTGEPVQGATVTLFTDEINLQHSQTTGMDGRYSMTIEKPKYYSYFKVVAYGYEATENLPLIPADDIQKVDFQILPLLLEFPFSGEFGATYFDITNNTSRTLHDVYISEYNVPITIGSHVRQRINNFQTWKPGYKITVRYNGMSKTWTY
jgi:hypothetical protein